MNTYVIIPHNNTWQLTHARLWELYKQCRSNIKEVIVVDDCSTDDMTQGGLQWWLEFGIKSNFKITAIQTPENLNFLRASNFGIYDTVSKCQPDDLLVLLSSDVEIRSNFIGQMTQILGQNKKTLIGGVLLSHDTGWNKFGEVLFPYLEGWLLAARAMDWIELGYFDERFSPSDYEDVDLSTQALKLGYELVPLNNPGIHHLGAQTMGYTDARRARTEVNRKKFEEKWIKHENK